MNECYLVSVIVPVYNGERFLKNCIESILVQEYSNIELLLIDDGSTDNSFDIIIDYSKKDRRIVPIHQSNHGVSYTRNRGIYLAKGEYICFVDADDLVCRSYLKSLMSEICKSETDVVFANYQLLYNEKKIAKKRRVSPGLYNFSDLSNILIDDGTLGGILFGSVWAALYKRDTLLKYDIFFYEDIKVNEDGLFNLLLVSKVKSFCVSDTDDYLYRQWRNNKKRKSFSLNKELQKASDRLSVFAEIFDDFSVQLKRRQLSVAFWNALECRKIEKSIFALAKEMKDCYAHMNLKNSFQHLDFFKIGKRKKYLAKLLVEERYILFLIIIKYIVPFVERRCIH